MAGLGVFWVRGVPANGSCLTETADYLLLLSPLPVTSSFLAFGPWHRFNRTVRFVFTWPVSY